MTDSSLASHDSDGMPDDDICDLAESQYNESDVLSMTNIRKIRALR